MNFAVVLILVLLPLLGFSQNEVNQELDSTEQDARALDELTQARDERQKAIGRIAEVTEKTKEAFDPQEAMKKLGYSGFSAESLLNKDALAIMEKTLKNSGLKNHPPELVREQILKSLEGNPFERFVRGSPNLQNFLVDVMRDENALLGLLHIVKNKEALKVYLYFWIAIMFGSYYTRKLFISKYWKGPFRSLASLLFTLTVSVITVSTFSLIFKSELKPIITIAKKYI